MKKQLLLVLIPLLMIFSTKINAQCTNSTIRPGDGFTLQGWNPTCNGGTDGYINISGITSSSAASPNANRPYFARILTAVGGGIHPSYPTPYPIPAGSTFQIPNLPAGTYVVDIIDQCGNTSADKSVTLGQPHLPEFNHTFSQIINRVTRNGVCGDTYIIDTRFARCGTGQIINFYFTNSLGATYIPVNNVYTTTRAAASDDYNETRKFEVPFAFFAGGSITIHLTSNLCSRPESTFVIPFPPTAVQLGGAGLLTSTMQSTANPCIQGYNIDRTLNYGTVPYTATIVETANPTVTALDVNGNPLTFNYPADHVWGGPFTTFSGLQYGVDYTITYIDACGLSVTETINIPMPANAVATQANCPGLPSNSPFIDDTGVLFVSLPAAQLKTFPITITINSGPANWVSTLGETTVTVPMVYPQTYTFSSPSSNGSYQLASNINITSPASDNGFGRPKQFAAGTYNMTYTDACGRTNNFAATLGSNCILNSTTSVTVSTCSYTNGNADITHKISPADRDTRSLYRINADGSETLISTLTKVLNVAPDIKFLNVPPGTYKIRFGGVTASGKIDYPGIGGVNGIPRIAGTNYIYEETVIVNPFVALSFDSLAACGTSITGIAEGGQAPYQYSLLNEAGTTVVQPTQTSGTFNGLTSGTIYTMQIVDNCGRTFNQQIAVNNLITPTISTIVQSTCGSSNNSVTLSNLPTGTWILTDSFDGTVTNGSGTNYTFNNLPVGNHSFTLSNSLGCAAPATAPITLNPQPTTINLVVTNPAIACTGSTVDITAAAITAGSDAGITLAYFEDAAATIPLANANSITAAGTYYIQATAGSCSSIQPVFVIFNDCSCTKPPIIGTPNGFTKVGITVQQKQTGWPENIPNGFIALESREKGFVITRVQNQGIIADPKAGMVIYDIDANCVKLYNGTIWNCIKRTCND
ncbi:hypothetical protein ASG31_00820 [Chryseobacterium sp. Leaf404]|nr:carboxypeptidase-like regulatory domain-containing protein [Chryseobacterium sp. Leaf313]KQT21919.1 hypothetical protein ASG31_00820 [Chryseobacterium sp. Leaf404]